MQRHEVLQKIDSLKLLLQDKTLVKLMLVLLLFLATSDQKTATTPTTSNLDSGTVLQYVADTLDLTQHPASLDDKETTAAPTIEVDTLAQLKNTLFHGFVANLRPEATEYQAILDFLKQAQEGGAYVTFDAATGIPDMQLLTSQIQFAQDHVVGVQDVDCLPAVPLAQQPTGIQRFVKNGVFYIVQPGSVQVLGTQESFAINTFMPVSSSTFDRGIHAQLGPDNRLVTVPEETHGARITNEVMRSIQPHETAVFCAGDGFITHELNFVRLLGDLESKTLVINRSLGVDATILKKLISTADVIRNSPTAPVMVFSNAAGNWGEQLALLGQGNDTISWVMATEVPTLLAPYSNYPLVADTSGQPFTTSDGTILTEIVAGHYDFFAGTSPATGSVSAAIAHYFETASDATLQSLKSKTSAEITQLAIVAAVGASPTLTYTVLEGGQIPTVTVAIPLEVTLAISNVLPLLHNFGIPTGDTIVTFADTQPSHITLPLFGVDRDSHPIGPLSPLTLTLPLLDLLKGDVGASFTYYTDRGAFEVDLEGTFTPRLSGFSRVTDALAQYPIAAQPVTLIYQDGELKPLSANHLPKNKIYTVPSQVYLPLVRR